MSAKYINFVCVLFTNQHLAIIKSGVLNALAQFGLFVKFVNIFRYVLGLKFYGLYDFIM